MAMVCLCINSTLPRYFRPGGPPGLIHWKIVAAWLKNEILTHFMLNLRFGNGNSYPQVEKKSLNKVDETLPGVF